ncbi:hypothetical protein [Janthinobacterium sp.]|uniref:hypothetical protein n=1 Tax=Janthinobacterium sp. TaxID=1871054 RepID=UPI00293D9276|nr:hypothetical protein [Janthinobacterium sp.]
MMNRTVALAVGALGACALSACAVFPDQYDPVKEQQYVSVINSLTWTNPLTGKRDGLRSAWPMRTLQGQTEVFPLAQVKECPAAGAPCAWGVLSASRSVARAGYVQGGVKLDLQLALALERRQEMRQDSFSTALTIPADVAALHWRKDERRALTLPYGKVERIEFEHGLRFEVCALRYDAAGQPLDSCAIPYI